jgi:nucleolar protein 14
LKQLKASLQDKGLDGPQKSKKQRKAGAQDGGTRHRRNVALRDIRERFNPFEVKTPAHKKKFEVVSASNDRPKKGSQGRPGVTKRVGEEMRRATLLKEIQSRNKAGLIVDRRFGENDPTMTSEQRAAERFIRQKERQLKKKSMFDLEDEFGENHELTHMGRSLNLLQANLQDEFKEDDLGRPGEDRDRPEGSRVSGLIRLNCDVFCQRGRRCNLPARTDREDDRSVRSLSSITTGFAVTR